MLARPDSSAIPGPSAASAAPFPAWARALHAPETAAEAGFLAGAALARLDAIVRENPPWAGAWRQRLALRSRRRQRRAAPAATKTRRRCATRSTSLGRAPIPDRRDAGCGPGARSRPDRPGNGAPRSRAPPRPWTSPATTRCKRRSRPREACAAGAIARRRSPPRGRSSSLSRALGAATAAGQGNCSPAGSPTPCSPKN